jgi:enamine deaminase RidA (YjgF/YER057c/UK114 family)
MAHKIVNPDTLYDPGAYGFSHSIQATGKTRVYCAGQVAWNKDYKIVGADDFRVQMRQAFDNLKLVLAASGATPEHVVQIRTYVVNHTTDKLPVISEETTRFFDKAAPRPNTLIGVAALALPEFMVEIEAVAEI